MLQHVTHRPFDASYIFSSGSPHTGHWMLMRQVSTIWYHLTIKPSLYALTAVLIVRHLCTSITFVRTDCIHDTCRAPLFASYHRELVQTSVHRLQLVIGAGRKQHFTVFHSLISPSLHSKIRIAAFPHREYILPYFQVFRKASLCKLHCKIVYLFQSHRRFVQALMRLSM